MADDDFDDSDDLDYYHDDPDQKINDKPDRKKNIVIGFCASVVLIVSAIFYLPSSIGGSIAIDTGAKKEFGVGVSARTACSGTNSLVIATSSSNSVRSESRSPSESQLDLSSTNLKLSSITVSNIPATCTEKDFIIRVYDESGSKLPLFNSTYSDTYVYMGVDKIFKAGLNSTGITVTSISTSKFSVAFNTPVSASIDVKNITIESAPPIPLCREYFICEIGEVGPGGGKVFYKNQVGFNCGPSNTATGSPTGSVCHYLEAAPALWNNTANDPSISWADDLPNNYRLTSVAGTATIIGAGYKNTLAIIAQGNTDIEKSAAARARAYRGGGYSDWFLASKDELNQLAIQKTMVGGFNNLPTSYQTSSQASTASTVHWQFFTSSNIDQGDAGNKSSTRGVRPVRAF